MVNKLITSAAALSLLLLGKMQNNGRVNELKNIYLDNDSFKNGTFRIQESARYILLEDIVFNPNPENDFKPLQEDIDSGKYPVAMGAPYSLGFFAAITVETTDVVIDLNGFCISQSESHYLHQRFFSLIELASSPFVPKQGPILMSNQNNFVSANNCVVRNGKLINSSHHGIHGNDCHHILLEDLEFELMEVAGIHLNGATETLIRNIKISEYHKNVQVIHTFSQCKIIKPFLEKLLLKDQEAFIMVNGEKVLGSEILDNLNFCLNNGPSDPLFENQTGLPDGNAYGIILSSRGVVINDFSQGRKETSKGNIDISIENVQIDDIRTVPMEIIGCQKDDLVSNPFTYGQGLFKGPVGDLINMRNVADKNFNELVLSQLILLKYQNSRTIHTETLLKYVQGENETFFEDHKNNFVSGLDSMAHTMKGNIGIFISEGINISMTNCHISNIKTIGDLVGQDNLIPSGYIKKQALNSYGLLVTGSEKVTWKNLTFENIESEYGTAKEVELLYYKADN